MNLIPDPAVQHPFFNSSYGPNTRLTFHCDNSAFRVVLSSVVAGSALVSPRVVLMKTFDN
mgnify:FL=1